MHNHNSQKDERGVALIVAFLIMAVIAGFSVSVLMFSTAEKNATERQKNRMTVFYAAESGLNHAMVNLENGGTGIVTKTTSAGLTYSTTVLSNGNYYTIRSTSGAYQNQTAIVEGVIQKQGGGVYYNAVFAGNSGKSPTYNMKFGGSGVQADSVTGDVYSGQNILKTGTAALNGNANAYGNITGWFGTTGVSQPIPDLASMNYSTTADINVNSHFTSASLGSWTYGGTAKQVASTDPCRIFRLNPSDRKSDYQSLQKTNNFFLEDKYAAFGTDSTSDGSSAAQCQINNNANNKVFYIDGNLWVNNLNTMSFKMIPETGGTPVKITVVVCGNVYIGDNLFYKNATTDGLAIIALKDSNVSDSGNIYFGDPNFGTLEHMDAFMYAENNFLDNNMGAAGSAKVTVNGNMTAGNQVAINRDFTDGSHSKLTVNFDARIKNGTLSLPNLPKSGTSGISWAFMAWRQIH
jgi:hypothetical protein